MFKRTIAEMGNRPYDLIQGRSLSRWAKKRSGCLEVDPRSKFTQTKKDPILSVRTSRPFYLPQSLSLEDYQKKLLLKLSSFNYEIEVLVGEAPESLRPVFLVPDTGAGPNLISQDLLKAQTLQLVRKNRELDNLRDANGNPLELLGTIALAIQVGTYQANVSFVVASRLSADVILACDFLDHHTQWIGTQAKTLALRDDSILSIFRRSSIQPEYRSTELVTMILQEPGAVAYGRIRVAKRVKLPPNSENVMLARCCDAGNFFLRPEQKFFDKYRSLITNGIADVRLNVSFAVIVAIFGDKPVNLSKNPILGYAVPQHDSEILSVHNAVQNLEEICKQRSQQRLRSPYSCGMPPHNLDETKQQVTIPQSLEELSLSHLPDDLKTKVLSVLKKHSSMWSGHLGEIKAPPYRIDLKPESKPVHSHPYRAGPKAREGEEDEEQRMLDAGVIEPAKSEWASSAVLIPKSDGSLRFCVDYKKFNA